MQNHFTVFSSGLNAGIKFFFLTLLIFVVSGIRLHAQNLVPNPGFENFTTCPVGFSEFNGYVSDWVDPSTASPDYMNSCANPFPAGVPRNGTGYQQAHSGNGYSGIYCTGGGFYTEYIQVQFTSPLIANNTYNFSMYVVLHNNSEQATDDIGAYFSIASPTSSGTGYLTGNPVPQISNPPGNIITDTLNWTLISGTYIATGNEQYLTIGHFKPDSLTTFIDLPYGSQGAYYYLDDVSLIPSQQISFEASSTLICEKFCVSFTDQSLNNPTSWLWEFPGGLPSTSTDQNPSQICYAAPGSYDVSLITTNANGSDTLTLPNYLTVNATPALPVITQNGNDLSSTPADNYQWQLNTVDIPGATNQMFTVMQSGFYTVVISDANGCQNSASYTVTLTGIDPVDEATVLVYPNPSNGAFNIQLPGKLTGKVSIRIMNALGVEVYGSGETLLPSEKQTVDIRNVSAGTYVLEISTGNTKLRKKVLIY